MIIPVNNNLTGRFDTKTLTFPSHLVNPADKNEKWCLDYTKAAYGRYLSDYQWQQRVKDYQENRKYAEGNQSVDKYVKWVSKAKDDAGNKLSYLDLDYSILSTIPKIINIVTGYLSKVDYEIQATAINPEAIDKKESEKAMIWAKAKNKPFFDQLYEQTGDDIFREDVEELPYIPSSPMELDFLIEMTYKMKEELKIELGAEAVMDENEWNKRIKPKLLHDAFCLGRIAIKIVTDPVTGRIKVDYIDPVQLLTDNTSGDDTGYRDERIGVFKMMSIGEIRLAAVNQFNDKQYEEIAQKFSNQFNNPSFTNFYPNTDANYRMYDSFRIPVLELYWYSIDAYKIKQKKRDGQWLTFTNTDYGTPVMTEDETRVKEIDVKTVYQSNWIVGTDYQYDWGKTKDIARPQENPRECFKPIHSVKIADKSHLERVIPLADALQLTNLRLQNTKARAMPSGIIVDISAFENVIIDGKIKKAADLFEMATQTGLIIHRPASAMGEDGQPQSYKPITPHDGGLGTEFQLLGQDLINTIQLIREVSGINEIMDSSDPNPKQLVGTAQLALNAAMSSLHPIVSGFTYIHEKAAIDIASKIRIGVNYRTISAYSHALGAVINMGSELSTVQMGIKIQARATQAQKEKLMEAAQMALTNTNDPSKGGIFYDDYLYIMRIVETGNLKLAETVLSFRIQKHLEQQAQTKQQDFAAQSEQQQKLAVIQQEEARKTEEFLSQLRIKENREKVIDQAWMERMKINLANQQDVNRNELKKELVEFQKSIV